MHCWASNMFTLLIVGVCVCRPQLTRFYLTLCPCSAVFGLSELLAEIQRHHRRAWYQQQPNFGFVERCRKVQIAWLKRHCCGLHAELASIRVCEVSHAWLCHQTPPWLILLLNDEERKHLCTWDWTSLAQAHVQWVYASGHPRFTQQILQLLDIEPR